MGIAPWYQTFAGVVETLAAALLFFRHTAFLGAALLLGALGDIVFVNFVYDGGVHMYNSYFVLLAAFLLCASATLCRGTTTPHFRAAWLRCGRLGLKVATIGVLRATTASTALATRPLPMLPRHVAAVSPRATPMATATTQAAAT